LGPNFYSLSLPNIEWPSPIRGEVKWMAANLGRSYVYQVGVQFNPYGSKKDQNPESILDKITELEEEYGSPQDE
jgi:hypothetical protein